MRGVGGQGEPASGVPRETSPRLTYALLAVSVALCVYGFVTGEAQVVLTKAIRVCLECIGIG